MDGTSLTPQQEKINALRQVMPELRKGKSQAFKTGYKKSGKDLINKTEKKDGYFSINDNELALISEKVNRKLITEVMNEYPKKVIALDRLFKGNDQLKTNTMLQMRDAGIEFKTL